MCLYNNAAKIFGIIVVLCRRLEIFEWKVVYETCGSCYVISTSAWVYFFEKSFRVPKIVPKVCNNYAALVNKECCIRNERIGIWIYIIMDMICWINVAVIMDLVSVNSALRHATP